VLVKDVKVFDFSDKALSPRDFLVVNWSLSCLLLYSVEGRYF
jgi:hypothetical protein